MEYEFLHDVTGQVKVRMSVDHEAVGHGSNDEVKENLALLDEVEAAMRAIKGSKRSGSASATNTPSGWMTKR
nr:Aconitate hydratase 2 [Candidatus Pantoea persica]